MTKTFHIRALSIPRCEHPSCKKHATHEVRDNRNEVYGNNCERHAEERRKDLQAAYNRAARAERDAAPADGAW